MKILADLVQHHLRALNEEISRLTREADAMNLQLASTQSELRNRQNERDELAAFLEASDA